MMGEVCQHRKIWNIRFRCHCESGREDNCQFIDNGIGMTARLKWKSISTRLLSPVHRISLKSIKIRANEDQIIGHFGLGFYSAFMVADKVTIDTLSYQEGASRFTGSLTAVLNTR
ncbi:MAG: hypothetical protein ACLUD2_10655 [Clostridium sp.]